MKILLVNDYGGATGGAELQMLALRQQLRDRGHDARLFASSALMVAGSANLADYRCYGTQRPWQVISQVVNISAYQALRQALREFQPDVVHVRMFLWQLSPLILPLLKAYPCLYQTAVYKAICPVGTNILPDGHSCRFEPGRACLQQGCLTPQSWIWMMGQRSLWQRWQGAFDRIVALSQGMKRELEQAGLGAVSVIYNGVPERSQRGPLVSPPTVGYAGRFSAEKGVETLLEAFAEVLKQVPSAQLVLAGAGSTQAALEKLSQRLKISDRITWLGHISRTELEQQFDSLWVQVVPSLWAEPFGNVTTEAMMRGTAVVASAVGAQPEIVGQPSGQNSGLDIAGTLVPPGNAKALATALVPILQQRSVAEQMGAAGHRRAIAEFGEATCTENFLSLYRHLQKTSVALDKTPQYLTT